MQTLPFSEFLDALRDRGFGVGLHEYLAAGKLIQHWDRTDRDELRNSLAALVARQDEEVDEIRRLFDLFYPPPPEAVAAPPPPRPPRRFWLVTLAGSRVAWAAVVALLVVGAFGWFTLLQLTREPLPTPPPSPLIPPVAARAFPPPEVRDDRAFLAAESLAEPPSVALPEPPARVDQRTLYAVGLTAFALMLVPLWGRRMRQATNRWTTDAWDAVLTALPGPFHADFVLKDLEPRLPRADIEEAATILGRASRAPIGRQRRGRLDVVRSLRATLRAGMQPHLVFKRPRSHQAILVLQDVSQSMSVHTRRVDLLRRDLGRQGIALEPWYFDGDLSRASMRRHGPATMLDTLLRKREDGPVMILGTGHGVAASLASTDQRWVTTLRQLSRRVWVNPVSDPRLWPTALQRLPVPAVSMTRSGLLQAARWLTQDDRTAFRQVNRAPRPVTRAHVEQLRRLASLVPYPSVDLLELLRQRFAAEIPESAVLHTVGRHAATGNLPFRMSDEDIRRYLTEVRATQPALEARVREYLLKVLADSEPPPASAAHLRWRAAVALHRVQLAELGGPDATADLQTLRALYEGPLWQEVREMVARQPTGGAAASALRPAVGADRPRHAPPRFVEGTSGETVPFRWRAPGWRLSGLSATTAAMAVLAAWLSGVFVVATTHRPGAYALEYVDSSEATPAGAAAVSRPGEPTGTFLRVRIATDDAVPNQVQLYRGASAVGARIPVDRTAAVTVPIDPASGAAVYQVRGVMENGALALSNTTWAPALLVVVDARPWARVTMASVEAGVEPFTQVTPFSIRLPAGTYDLELRNDVLSADTVTRQRIVVGVTGARTFSFDMPGFDLNRALGRLGIRPPASAK